MMLIIVMGVSGSGKSSTGRLLAERLGWTFADADDFHPPANVKKMHEGTPLNDLDREPWLQTLREQINHWQQDNISAVLACSALKESYRKLLGYPDQSDIKLVYLRGSYQQIYQRLSARSQHFMPADLLSSQFADLEEPTHAVIIDIDQPSEHILTQVMTALDL